MQELPNIQSALENGFEIRGRYINLAGSDARCIISACRGSSEVITVEGKTLSEALDAANVALNNKMNQGRPTT
jgi:hypothetical protein